MDMFDWYTRNFGPDSGWPWRRAGVSWREGVEYEVLWGRKGVKVSAFRRGEYQPAYVEDFPRCGPHYGDEGGEGAMVSKYIAAARARAKEAGLATCRCDPLIGENRPALSAFLTETDAGEGRVRERSVLMIACEEGGTRVGLKDADLGGWVWRTGQTLLEALDAIEKALTDPQAAFRVKPRPRAARARRRR